MGAMSLCAETSEAYLTKKLTKILSEHFALIRYSPELRKIITRSALIGEPGFDPNSIIEKDLTRQANEQATNNRVQFFETNVIASEVTQKMDIILGAESISSYCAFYKKTHEKYEKEMIFSPTEYCHIENPNTGLAGKLNLYIGGRLYRAFRRPIQPISWESLREQSTLRFSIFIEHAAITGLIDACLHIDLNIFFSREKFLSALSNPKNMGAAIRANRALYKTKEVRRKLDRYSSKERIDFEKMLEKVDGNEKDRRRIRHTEIYRAFLLVKMCDETLFNSGKLTAKDYINIFEKFRIKNIPLINPLNRIRAKFV